MDKIQLLNMAQKGFRILRAKSDIKGWRICERTQKGGWSVYAATPYQDKESCEAEIKNICAKDKQFIIDN